MLYRLPQTGCCIVHVPEPPSKDDRAYHSA
jgi:hypothetical protein